MFVMALGGIPNVVWYNKVWIRLNLQYLVGDVFGARKRFLARLKAWFL